MDNLRSFVFELPTRIEFGVGSLSRLSAGVESLGGARVLLVSDKGLVAAGLVDKITASLDDGKLDYILFTDVEAEPDASGVHAGADLFREKACDVVVAVGGGSALDTGKAIALVAHNPGHIRDYAGLDVPAQAGAPVIAIPTTAGTGSEATIWAVISEKTDRTKYGVGGPHLTADIAVCDPTLSASLPSALTATTGLDALAHALESYVNKATQPISEALSEKAMELIARSLRTAVNAGDELAARSDMLLASTMAAAAFNPTRLGLAHALAIPLGSKAKIPHGEVVSILLPEVMRFNVVANPAKFARIAEIFGEPLDGLSLRSAADAGVAAVQQLIDDVGAPHSLGDYAVTEAHLPALAEEGLRSGNVAVNPRHTSHADLVGIMHRCL